MFEVQESAFFASLRFLNPMPAPKTIRAVVPESIGIHGGGQQGGVGEPAGGGGGGANKDALTLKKTRTNMLFKNFMD